MPKPRAPRDVRPAERDSPDGVRTPRSDGSADSGFSADGDSLIRDAELPGGHRDPPGERDAPTTPLLPPNVPVRSPLASVCSVATAVPNSDHYMTESMRRIADRQQQIADLLFDTSCKVPNSLRSQILTWLAEIVQDCSDVRAYAAHQSGRVDELRYQLRLAHRQACVAPVAAAPVPSLARTYAQAVNHGLPLPSSAVHPAAAPAPGTAPQAHPDLAVPARPDAGYRREHAHIMFLTPIAPSSAPARDVATLLSANLDPVTVGIGDVSMKHTRHGITVFTDDKQSLDRLKSAIESHAVTSAAISVRVAVKRRSHVRVSGVDPGVSGPNLISAINARNSTLQLNPESCHVRVSFRERSGAYTHVIEVDAAAFRSLLARGKLMIGWTSVAVREDLHVPTCTFCATYGHSRRACPHKADPSKAQCTKCAGSHLVETCSVRVGDAAVTCAVCRRLDRASSHPTGDAACPVLVERVARMRARTDYG
ncbi:hypothetical protein HPB49_012540 [Dermacentor silvarum]|uniref:Uncharacterized protein n=1 Tax=Dermacentor silvarum TaxID=543639 RepID=A0ACB8DD76_DERSI|nr:hypothetical protein HPB49_012540 [Dermacentor silvarum]